MSACGVYNFPALSHHNANRLGEGEKGGRGREGRGRGGGGTGEGQGRGAGVSLFGLSTLKTVS